MSKYTTNVSDKRKGIARKKFLQSGFGMLGLHYFYVGRIGRGLVHIAVSAIMVLLLCTFLFGNGLEASERISYIVTLIFICILINAPTFYFILMGKFKDNVGAYLREE